MKFLRSGRQESVHRFRLFSSDAVPKLSLMHHVEPARISELSRNFAFSY